MAVFTLPDFNLVASVWVAPNTPFGGGPADFTNKPCQLYVQNRPVLSYTQVNGAADDPIVIIRVDYKTFDDMGPLLKSVWQIVDQFANKWFYSVCWWEYIHRGFPNEYIEMQCVQSDNAGVPPDGNR